MIVPCAILHRWVKHDRVADYLRLDSLRFSIASLRDHKPRKQRTICAERVNQIRETWNRFALLGTSSRN
jgi:hypothetical protein